MIYTKISVNKIEVIKSDININVDTLFIDLILTESISNVIPICELRLVNDADRLRRIKLSTEDTIKIEVEDSFSNNETLLFKVRNIEYTQSGDGGDIRDKEVNVIKLTCIPLALDYFNKTNIFKSFKDKNTRDIITGVLPYLKINPAACDIEPSANTLNYYSCKPFSIMLDYLMTNALSNTNTPFLFLVKNDINLKNIFMEFKSVGQLFTEGRAKPRKLKFVDTNLSDDKEFLLQKRNNIILASRHDDYFQQENLFYNKLRNNEIQKLDIFTGQVDTKENYNIKDFTQILEEFPTNSDLESNQNIKFISRADMNYDNNVQSYFYNKYLLTFLNLHTYIYHVTADIDIHIGDVCTITELEAKEVNPLLINFQMITDVTHIISNDASETSIRTMIIDPKAFINSDINLRDFLRQIPTIGGFSL